MTIKKFIVEIDYTPYEGEDPIDNLTIEEGVTEIMSSLAMDGEIEDFNSISVKRPKE